MLYVRWQPHRALMRIFCGRGTNAMPRGRIEHGAKAVHAVPLPLAAAAHNPGCLTAQRNFVSKRAPTWGMNSHTVDRPSAK